MKIQIYLWLARPYDTVICIHSTYNEKILRLMQHITGKLFHKYKYKWKYRYISGLQGLTIQLSAFIQHTMRRSWEWCNIEMQADTLKMYIRANQHICSILYFDKTKQVFFCNYILSSMMIHYPLLKYKDTTK